jgi:hypothetical protein
LDSLASFKCILNQKDISVVKVVSGFPSMQLRLQRSSSREYVIEATLMCLPAPGDFGGIIRVITNDPEEKEVRVPFSGVVELDQLCEE